MLVTYLLNTFRKTSIPVISLDPFLHPILPSSFPIGLVMISTILYLISLDLRMLSDNSFYSVQTFRIDGLNELQTLKIGKKSFSLQAQYIQNEYKSFHILNCASLESIEIGEFCFSDFGGEFELSNLPSLQLLKIGGTGSDSGSFYYVNPIIRGIG